ncbi:MAG TPA: DUF1269 domain-containing protein [Methylococcus sp.]|nr:DUF1269 domain-containing protein [Methylococcus sp.]
MSELIVFAFKDDTTAYEMRAALAKMQKNYLIEMEDVVIVHKDERGEVKLDQMVNLTARGAIGGGFWGLLIGLLFMNPLLGAAVGAGAGAISASLTDIGINDDFMRELGETLTPGTSALFVLLRKATADKLLDGLREFAGRAKVLQSSLSKDQEEDLRAVIESARKT